MTGARRVALLVTGGFFARAPDRARAQRRDLFPHTSGGFPLTVTLNDAKALMCTNGPRTTQDGSGNQTPLGGKFTGTCS